eukprot:CAMPEP_0175735466 /NCGR_PEP_ID=MMETSP0097-20121207/52914_1 /TAXON_ID=311494 /ORGANISM="Alexandrium monilatum, Strain CCMP3105" /LENGTH=44 /DNA_ID= /DNA_START= /DNA_END= /DNA_ORIENTATION=
MSGAPTADMMTQNVAQPPAMACPVELKILRRALLWYLGAVDRRT